MGKLVLNISGYLLRNGNFINMKLIEQKLKKSRELKFLKRS